MIQHGRRPTRQPDRQTHHRDRGYQWGGSWNRAAARSAGAHVILAVRNTELGAQRAAEIGGSTSIAKLDLADLSSVRVFPDQLDGDVDILINNAGGVSQHRTDTVDGFEMTIGTNFLGPFALTNLLLGRVRSQIINVGSDAINRQHCASTTCTCARTDGRPIRRTRVPSSR